MPVPPNSDQVTYFGAFIAGILSFLSPCVLPLIPSYITYITGLSFADLQAEHPLASCPPKNHVPFLAFILGFTVVFVLLGASATFLGTFLQPARCSDSQGGRRADHAFRRSCYRPVADQNADG